MEHPELFILIQQSKLADSRRQQMSMPRRPGPRLVHDYRSSIGRALISLGVRIAPESRPTERREPLGKISIAGRADI